MSFVLFTRAILITLHYFVFVCVLSLGHFGEVVSTSTSGKDSSPK